MNNFIKNLKGLELSQESKNVLLKRLRTEKTENNFKEFCKIYFPHYFYAKPSLMHEELFVDIQEAIENNEKDNMVCAAPRGNAKSSIISFALPLWCALFKKKHYIVIVSDTADQANDFLSSIRAELEDNATIINDFGNVEGYVWTSSDLIFKNDEVRIQALGAGKKIRGRRFKQWRPDLIIGDDLENDENVRSVDQRKFMEQWHDKALSNAGDERTDKIIIGTIMHYDSLLAKLLKNPTYKSKIYRAILKWSASPLWDQWEKIITDLEDLNRLNNAKKFFAVNKKEMLEGTEVLWPDKEDYYNLMLQRLAYGPAAFSSEKQNEPLSDDDRRFLPEWIQYYDDEDIAGKDLYVVGFVDPSMGKQGGDYSAIITIASDYNHKIYVLDADIARRHPDIIALDVIAKQGIYHYKVFGAEANQFQEFFKDTIQSKANERGVDISIKGIKQHSDKILRIQSLQPDIKNGRVKFRRDQQRLIEQLVNFPSAANDDGPDALEGAMSLLGKRSSIADFYREQTHEHSKPNTNSFLQDPNLQGFNR